MKRLIQFLFLVIVLLLAPACAPDNNKLVDSTMQTYLQALTEQNASRLSTVVCADWEADAFMEMDSFQAVNATLENVSCQQSNSKDGDILATCTGKILVTYDSEQQSIDLSQRVYRLRDEGGDLRVCGYQQ